MRILVECTVIETGEVWEIEMEGPDADTEQLTKSVLEALGDDITESVTVKIKEIPNGTIH